MHIQLVGIVEPKSPDGKVWRFPYGLPTVISELMNTDHSYDVIDTHLHKKTNAELFEFLKNCKATVYGISAWTEGYKLTKEMSKVIRCAHPDATIIVGGFLALTDKALMDHTEVDIAVTTADGHLALPEILDVLDGKGDMSDVRGITWRGADGAIRVNAPRPLMSKEQYDNSPMPAYDAFRDEILELVANTRQTGYGKGDKDEPVRPFPLMVSRGCPFDCTFCGMLEGQNFYRKKWGPMFDEMEYLMNNFGVEGFISNDTNFCLNDKDIEAYCEEYERRGSTFKIITNNRPLWGSSESLKNALNHGNVVATFGWETGSQEMLDVMRKKSKAADVRAHCHTVAESGMIIYGNFLFGMPGENKRTIRETADFMMELEEIFAWQRQDFKDRDVPYRMSSGYNYSILIAMPATEVYDAMIDLGMIEDMDAYLCYLDPGEQASEEYTRQHSRYKGSDINLSEFSSKDAMIYYVRYQMALVKTRAQLLRPFGIGMLRDTFKHARAAAAEFTRHHARVVYDFVMRTESAEFKEKKREVKRRMLLGPAGYRTQSARPSRRVKHKKVMTQMGVDITDGAEIRDGFDSVRENAFT